jgi:hypothetical protein
MVMCGDQDLGIVFSFLLVAECIFHQVLELIL